MYIYMWLILVLESYNIPDELISIVADIYEHPKFKVEVEGNNSDWFVQSAGIRQGCPLSPYLFLLVMDRIFDQVARLREKICMG